MNIQVRRIPLLLCICSSFSSSGCADSGNADGEGKGLLHGTNTCGAQGKVSPPTALLTCQDGGTDASRYEEEIQRQSEEIQRLYHEVELRGGNPRRLQPMGSSAQHGAASQAPPPPSLGHGPSNLFGGIMQGGGNGSLAPPPQQQQQQDGQGPPPHQMPQPPPPSLQGPQGPPPAPFQQTGGYPPAPASNGYGGPPPQSTASPGPGKARINPRAPGPATPHLNQPMPYPDPRASPQVPHHGGQIRGPQPYAPENHGNALAEIDLEQLQPHHKKQSEDWFAIFNPQIPRVLDVELLHTLQHESVVCCVRFSHDGKFVATGCNRSAQIFDVVTGNKYCVLQDESVDAVGDLYIRSVCFSPDGRYLATGAEDKLIRVRRSKSHDELQLTSSRCGTFKQGLFATRLPVTNKIFTLSTLLGMAARLLQVLAIGRFDCGTLKQVLTFSL